MADVNVQRGDTGTPERQLASRKAPASGRPFIEAEASVAKAHTLLRVLSGSVEASNVLPVRSLPLPASTFKTNASAFQSNTSARLPLSKATLPLGYRPPKLRLRPPKLRFHVQKLRVRYPKQHVRSASTFQRYASTFQGYASAPRARELFDAKSVASSLKPSAVATDS